MSLGTQKGACVLPAPGDISSLCHLGWHPASSDARRVPEGCRVLTRGQDGCHIPACDTHHCCCFFHYSLSAIISPHFTPKPFHCCILLQKNLQVPRDSRLQTHDLHNLNYSWANECPACEPRAKALQKGNIPRCLVGNPGSLCGGAAGATWGPGLVMVRRADRAVPTDSHPPRHSSYCAGAHTGISCPYVKDEVGNARGDVRIFG